MANNEAHKKDKKHIAILVGGSFLVSLVTVIVGTLLAGNANPVMAGTGYAVQALGWFWVAGTVGISLMAQAQMRQFYRTVEA